MAGNSITLNLRSKWPDVPDDYLVWYEDREIGRIRLVRDPTAPDTAWEWYISVPLSVPSWGRGATTTRDAAIRDFSSAWGRFVKETRPDSLQRAWEFERTALLRLRQNAPTV
jgi:hypothetical protein